jgi:DNA-binding NtrC family response regulator
MFQFEIGDDVRRAGKLLIADKSGVVRQLVAQMMRSTHADVAMADTVEMARDAVAGGAISVAIVDVDLPGGGIMAVLEACARIGPSRPLVIALAQTPSLAEETELSLAGLAGYLTKPVNVHALRRLVSSST